MFQVPVLIGLAVGLPQPRAGQARGRRGERSIQETAGVKCAVSEDQKAGSQDGLSQRQRAQAVGEFSVPGQTTGI